jgi:hypothetical protein
MWQSLALELFGPQGGTRDRASVCQGLKAAVTDDGAV